MSVYRKIYFSVLVGFLLIGSLPAQEPPPEVNIRFRTYVVGRTAPEGLSYLDGDGRLQSLQFRRFMRSIRRYAYAGNAHVQIMSGEVGGVREIVGEVTLPDGAMGEWLLIFQAEREREGLFRVFAMPDSVGDLPVRHVRFFNATGRPLSGVFGEESVDLPNGLSPVFPIESETGEGVEVGLAVHYKDAWRAVLHNRWRFSPNHRTVIFLLPPEPGSPQEILAIRLTEYVQPDDEKARQEEDS